MFTPVSSRAASAYQRINIETSVDGANPHQLVALLYQALLRAIAAARTALARGDIAAKGAEISKAVRILEEGLKSGLNVEAGGEVALNLRGVYGYCVGRLTQANLKNDDARLAEVVALIEPIAQAWVQIQARADVRPGP